MIKVQIKSNNEIIKEAEYHQKVSLKAIVEDLKLVSNNIITFKVNNQFVYDDTMIEKDSEIELIYINSHVGLKIYQDSAIFLLGMAVHKLFGNSKTLFVEHSIGDGVYCDLLDEEVTSEIIEKIHSMMKKLTEAKTSINKMAIPINQAYEIFQRQNRADVIKNLAFHKNRYIEIYMAEDYYDYFPRPLSPNTCFIKHFSFILENGGFVLRFPSMTDGMINTNITLPQKLFAQNQEHDKWLNILDVDTVGDLNRLIDEKQIRDFILTEKPFMRKR